MILVYGMRAEKGRQCITLFDLSWECVHHLTQFFLQFYMSVNDHESATTKSENKEDHLCVCVCVCCVCIHTTKSISWKLKTLGTSEMENLNSGLENKVKEPFQKTNKQQKQTNKKSNKFRDL